VVGCSKGWEAMLKISSLPVVATVRLEVIRKREGLEEWGL
jgi:hypothetical protein